MAFAKRITKGLAILMCGFLICIVIVGVMISLRIHPGWLMVIVVVRLAWAIGK